MPVRVVTDSASDLPPPLSEAAGIAVVPLSIRFGDQEFVDREELSTEEFWQRLAASDVLPETAAPSAGAFEETFRRLAGEGADGIVCVNLSSALSATMQSAQLAATALEGTCPVTVIDSKTASMGVGDLALHAARRAAEGAGLDEIVADLEARRGRVHLLAALDTLDYLRKGGRIGGAQAMVGSLLSIKPIIELRDGEVLAAGRVRTRAKALRFLAERVPVGRVETMSVLHANAKDLDELLDLLAPAMPSEGPVTGLIGPVIGVHAGPGTIGVVWTETPA